MADRIQLDGKTYLPLIEAAGMAGVSEKEVMTLAQAGRVFLRAIGKKVYVDVDGLQNALHSQTIAPSVTPPMVPPKPPASVAADTLPAARAPAPSVAPAIVVPKPAAPASPAQELRASSAVSEVPQKALSHILVPPKDFMQRRWKPDRSAMAARAAAQSTQPTMPAMSPSPDVQKVVAAQPVTTAAAAPVSAPLSTPVPAITPSAPPVVAAVEKSHVETHTAPPVKTGQQGVIEAKPAVQKPPAPTIASPVAVHSLVHARNSAELSAMGSITQENVPMPRASASPVRLAPSTIQSLATTAAALATFVLVVGGGVAVYERSPAIVALLDGVGKQVAAVIGAGPTMTYEASAVSQGASATGGSPSENQAQGMSATLPKVSGTSTQPIYYVYNYPVIERVVEEARFIDADDPQDFTRQLNELYQRIQTQIQSLNITTNTQFAQQYQVIAQTNNIDKLGSVTIDNNSTFSGGTVTGSTLTDIAALTVTGNTTLGALSVGDITASGGGTFTGAGTFSYVVASSTSATSTFNGAILATRAPSTAHTFASWSPGVADTAWYDAALVINPASATGDSNLFAAAVNGSAKFLIDAEGDVYVNNLTSVGDVTLSTTSASTFVVEGNTTLGDSITDTTTVNGTLVVTGTTTASTVAGNFGVGTSTPWGKLSVAGAAGGSIPLFAISSSTSGYATSSAFIIDYLGRVGVGTSSPSNMFEVAGSTLLGGNLAVNGTTNFTGGSTFTGLSSFSLASTSQLSVFQKAYFGGTATSTFDSAGNLDINQYASIKQNGTSILFASTTVNGATLVGANTPVSRLLSTSYGVVAVGQSALRYATTTNNYSVAVGYEALMGASNNGSTGSSNVAVGGFALTANTTGGQNTGVGGNALAANTSGTQNTALGYAALDANTTGGTNVGIGVNALTANTTGSGNIAVGSGALTTNSIGSNNLAIGSGALNFNTADSNTGIGYQSLYENTSGTANTAVGQATLRYNITGTNNTAFGYGASWYNASATSTTAFGAYAGRGNSSTFSSQGSTVVGYSAGLNFNTGSDYNTLLGYQAGYGITTGARNVLLGQSTIAASYNQVTTGSNNIAIGNDVALPSATASNQLNIGNLLYGLDLDGTGSTVSSGRIGIGTTTPTRRLSVTDTVAAAQVAFAYDTTRWSELRVDSTGDMHLAASGADFYLNNDNFWVCTGGSITTGGCPSGTPTGAGNLIVENKIGIGTTTPAYKLTIETQDASTNFLQIASSTAQSLFVVNANGNIGVGTSTPFARLAVGPGGSIITTENGLTDGATIAVNWLDGNQQKVTLGGNRSITFANYVAGGILRLVVCQDATGSRTLSWPAAVRWQGGSAPTLTTTANQCDLVSFVATNATSSLVILGAAALAF